MDELLRKLENESLLLLYLAGELPDQDRLELEALLQTDGGLRSQLADLRQAWNASNSAFAQLDAAQPLPSTERSVREVSRSIRQWQVDRLTAPAVQAAPMGRRWYLVYSGAVAAMLLVGFCVWWGLRSDPASFSTSQPSPTEAVPLVDVTPPANTDPNVPVVPPAPQPPVQAPAFGSADRPRQPFAFVSLDANSQRLADLEQVVHEDLQ